MIGQSGWVNFASFLHYLEELSTPDELELTRHSFLPDCWCIGNSRTGRWIQLSVTNLGTSTELNYLLEGVGNQTRYVNAPEYSAERVLKYLRKEYQEI